MCDKHPRYTGKRKPRTTCPFCYEDYTMLSTVIAPVPDHVREWIADQVAGLRDGGIPSTSPCSSYYDWYQTEPCPYGLDIGNYYHHLTEVKCCENQKCKLECKPSNEFLVDRGIYKLIQ